MTKKRMLTIPLELVHKIDKNRGDLTQAEFIHFLIENALAGKTNESNYATKEELVMFKQDMKKLLKKFIDFFLNYGLELGKQVPLSDLEKLTSKLGDIESNLPLGSDKEVKIKYK